jgi:drug/metabolite transporter (DMT)-like permease
MFVFIPYLESAIKADAEAIDYTYFMSLIFLQLAWAWLGILILLIINWRSKQRTKRDKWEWTLLLVIFNILAAPFFWYHHVWNADNR